MTALVLRKKEPGLHMKPQELKRMLAVDQKSQIEIFTSVASCRGSVAADIFSAEQWISVEENHGWNEEWNFEADKINVQRVGINNEKIYGKYQKLGVYIKLSVRKHW